MKSTPRELDSGGLFLCRKSCETRGLYLLDISKIVHTFVGGGVQMQIIFL